MQLSTWAGNDRCRRLESVEVLPIALLSKAAINNMRMQPRQIKLSFVTNGAQRARIDKIEIQLL